MLSRWMKAAREQQWEQIPDWLRKRIHEVPNHLRTTLGIRKLKGRSWDHVLPLDCQRLLDSLAASRVHGVQSARVIGAPVEQITLRSFQQPCS